MIGGGSIEVSEDNYQKIQSRLNQIKSGDTITVTVLRAGRILHN